MNKLILRYARRLLLWFERPLRSEEKEIIWATAKAYEYKRIMRELGLVRIATTPQKPHQAQQKFPPLTIRQRATMQRFRASLPPTMPVEQPAPPPPVQHVELIDESWLNSMPIPVVTVREEEQEEDDMSTDKVPVISRLLHSGGNAK